MKSLGLWVYYLQDGHIRETIQKILCLCYIPAKDVREVFNSITCDADDSLLDLFRYIEDTWLNGIWSPESWSTFNLSIRTNNDAEGLHNLWNQRGRANSLPFYHLTDLLFREAEKIAVQEKLVRNGKLRRQRRVESVEKDRLLMELANDYKTQKITAMEMLNICAAKFHLQFSSIVDENTIDEMNEYM